MATNPIDLIFIFAVPEIPNPNSQIPGKVSIPNKSKRRNHVPPLFEMIEEKIKVSSRASDANASQLAILFFVRPVSTNRKNMRLSFASFRQIFARIKKSFLLNASSASIQLAATEPDARTNCRISSVLLIVLGNCLTKARTDSANRNVRSSRSRGLAPSSILELGGLVVYLGFGAWDLELAAATAFR